MFEVQAPVVSMDASSLPQPVSSLCPPSYIKTLPRSSFVFLCLLFSHSNRCSALIVRWESIWNQAAITFCPESNCRWAGSLSVFLTSHNHVSTSWFSFPGRFWPQPSQISQSHMSWFSFCTQNQVWWDLQALILPCETRSISLWSHQKSDTECVCEWRLAFSLFWAETSLGRCSWSPQDESWPLSWCPDFSFCFLFLVTCLKPGEFALKCSKVFMIPRGWTWMSLMILLHHITHKLKLNIKYQHPLDGFDKNVETEIFKVPRGYSPMTWMIFSTSRLTTIGWTARKYSTDTFPSASAALCV